MAVTEHAGGTRTSGTVPEASFTTLGTADDATDGAFQLAVNLTNLARGDTVILQLKAKFASAGTAVVVWEIPISNAQTEPGFYSPTLMHVHGFTYGIKQTAGTARSFEWSILKA